MTNEETADFSEDELKNVLNELVSLRANITIELIGALGSGYMVLTQESLKKSSQGN